MESGDVRINGLLSIPLRDLRVTFSRSSGPGGQNVNKLSTKALLRFDLAGSTLIDDKDKALIASRAGGRINSRGQILVSSESHRTAEENRKECMHRFAELMRRWIAKPKPRKATKPGPAAKRRRLDEKKRRSGKKNLRQKPKGDDE